MTSDRSIDDWTAKPNKPQESYKLGTPLRRYITQWTPGSLHLRCKFTNIITTPWQAWQHFNGVPVAERIGRIWDHGGGILKVDPGRWNGWEEAASDIICSPNSPILLKFFLGTSQSAWRYPKGALYVESLACSKHHLRSCLAACHESSTKTHPETWRFRTDVLAKLHRCNLWLGQEAQGPSVSHHVWPK